MTKNFKIWHVTSGPFSMENSPNFYDEGYEEGLDSLPTKPNYLVIAMVEKDGKLREEEFWFPEEWQAYKFKHLINSEMEALEVNQNENMCENNVDF
jgi:hypothetical protein